MKLARLARLGAVALLSGCAPKAAVAPPRPLQSESPGRIRSDGAAAATVEAAGAAWKPFARLPEALSLPMAAAVDGKIFVIDGNPANGVPTAAVNAFDLRRREWTPRRSAPQAIGLTAFAVLDGLIYAAGGCARLDCSFPTAAFSAYDPKEDAWKPLPPMPEAIYGGQGAALNGRFYVFGGIAGPIHRNAASTRAYVYDPSSRAWSRLRDMPKPRAHAAGAEFQGRYVLVGGCSSETRGRPCDKVTASVDAYDAGSDSWSAFAPLPVALWSHSAAADGGRLIVAGGSSVSTIAGGSRTFVFGSDGAWTEGPSLLRPRYFPVLVNLTRGMALIGAAANAPDDLIESLGASGPFLDPREGSPRVALPAVSRRPVARAPDAAFDAESPDSLPPAVAPRPNTHAVVIGVERYRETLPRADFAASDARLTAEYFRRVLGVPAENLALLSDDRATKSDFEKYFERWLPNRVEPGDEVYVYFSGHGAPNAKTGESYLVPFDADPTYIEQTGYPIKKMFEQLAKLPAKRVLLVMDSCFSGAGGRSVIAQGVRPLVTVVQSGVPRPLIVITASSGEQISNSYQEKRHGLFTYFFLKGLKEKGADFRAVYDYLKPQVSRVARRQYNSDQVPQWRKAR